jgi:hypothetical protein
MTNPPRPKPTLPKQRQKITTIDQLLGKIDRQFDVACRRITYLVSIGVAPEPKLIQRYQEMDEFRNRVRRVING